METALKQRLIGAVVLVVLAVIFVPMLLDESGSRTPPSAADTPVPAAPSSVIPPPPPGPPPMVKPPAPEPSVPPAHAPPAGVAPTAPAQAGSSTAGQRKSSNTDAGTRTTAWRVQVASFSDRAHALALRNKLRVKGYQAFVQEVHAGHRLMYRVLIGPGMNRTRADALQARLRKDMKLNGIVIPAAGR
ncbi:MAG: SPOR domain-containing protein [Gammaproteobacteria bacterium]|nr:SPOR domain-containing protein [Gammaproteobacteria bacterium]